MKPKDPFSEKADQLEQRIRKLHATTHSDTRKPEELPFAKIGLARLGIEMIAGVLIGLGLGISLDRLLDSSPWGLLIGFCFGAVAGFWNIRRFFIKTLQDKK